MHTIFIYPSDTFMFSRTETFCEISELSFYFAWKFYCDEQTLRVALGFWVVGLLVIFLAGVRRNINFGFLWDVSGFGAWDESPV